MNSIELEIRAGDVTSAAGLCEHVASSFAAGYELDHLFLEVLGNIKYKMNKEAWQKSIIKHVGTDELKYQIDIGRFGTSQV